MIDKNCLFCHKDFLAERHSRKYCSSSCFGKTQIPRILEYAGKGRPVINDGLNKAQRYYRINRENVLNREKEKRVFLINFLGGKCITCGFEDIRALELDHKNNDGYLDRKRIGNKVFRYYYNHLEEALEKLQILCANCNKIKAKEENEYNYSRRLVLI